MLKISKIYIVYAKWKDIQSHRSFIIICLARSLRQRVASFYAASNGIFEEKNLLQLLKICKQIMCIVWIHTVFVTSD